MSFDDGRPEPASFEFRGDTYEWLGIWIINLFLSIVTLGIYSAWAKVRMRKYFYQHTFIAGRSFDYHATGLQIFIGRVIIIVGLIVFSLLSAIPILGLIAVAVLLVLIPLLLVRALRFNAVMSSWSNVRFGFYGTAGRAFLVYLLFPFLTLFTLYLAWPFADRARRGYSVGNHRFGTAPFAFSAPIGPFYKAFLMALGWLLVVAGLLGIAAIGPILQISRFGSEPDPVAMAVLTFIIYAFIFLAIFPASAIYMAFIRNVTFNGAMLDGKHRFRSDVRPGRLIWILLTNAFAVLFSMGLLMPWAQIRLARYYAAHTQLLPGGSLDDFAGRLEAQASALGDAYTDIEGFDVGLPI